MVCDLLHGRRCPAVVFSPRAQSGRFSDLLARRFGPPARSNPLGELIKLQRVSTVVEYTDHFIKLLARCDDITELQQIDIFTTGLGDPLRIDVELHHPVSLEDAMGLARSYERRNPTIDATAPSAGAPSRVAAHRSSPVTPAATLTGTSCSTPPPTPAAPTKPKPQPGGRFTSCPRRCRSDATPASATTVPRSTRRST